MIAHLYGIYNSLSKMYFTVHGIIIYIYINKYSIHIYHVFNMIKIMYYIDGYTDIPLQYDR